MKKLIMALALIASTITTTYGGDYDRSIDTYKFTTSIKYPEIGKTAFVPATTSVTGEMVVSDTNIVLVVTVKKTKQTYVLVCEDPLALAVLGKKTTDCSTEIKFVNEDPDSDGILEMTFSGWGTIKTKKTGGCTPCGDTTEICSKFTKLTGVVLGKYACPCGGTFIEWDGSCDLDPENKTAEVCPFKGSSATFTLKTVDGKKW